MIKEAIDALISLGKQTINPVRVNAENPFQESYLVGSDFVYVPRMILPRRHLVTDFTSLVDLANRFAEDHPVIWVGDEHVRLVLDDSGHRDSVVQLDLFHTEVFSKLVDLASAKPWLDQKAFVRMLRIDLAASLAPSILLDRVKKLRFENGQTVTASVARDRESMGRTITSQVSAEGEIPETVALATRVYKGQGPFEVTCSVEVDAARGLLQLAPMPDEIDRVTQLALAEIHGMITADVEESVLIYFGSP